MDFSDDDLLEEERNPNKEAEDKEWGEKRKFIDDFFSAASKEPIEPPEPIPEPSNTSIVFDTLEESSDDEEPAVESQDEEPEEEAEEQGIAAPTPQKSEPTIIAAKIDKNPWWRNLTVWLVIIIVLLILSLAVIFFIGRILPPNIRFVDANTNESLYGTVLYNGVEIGDFSTGYFKKLPYDFCRNTSNIALKSGGEVYVADTYPGDCGSRKLTYIVNKKEIGISEIILDFSAEDTGEKISGQLFIDGDFYGDTSGTSRISISECRMATNITIISSGKHITWINNKESCSEGARIPLVVPSIK